MDPPRPHPDYPLVVAYGLGVNSTAMLVEFAKRWLDHLEARQFSPGKVRSYAFDLLCLARFFAEVGIEWRQATPTDFFDWLEWQSTPTLE